VLLLIDSVEPRTAHPWQFRKAPEDSQVRPKNVVLIIFIILFNYNKRRVDSFSFISTLALILHTRIQALELKIKPLTEEQYKVLKILKPQGISEQSEVTVFSSTLI
jgi:hypothetical protein